MIAVFVILAFVIFLGFFYPIETKQEKPVEKSTKYDAQMKKLWSVAQSSMRERKPFRAEKALLTILKFDEKNAAAYNRLGILYAKSERYEEAVECFEIAQSLDNNPASIHNAGLIYLEIGEYEKAEMAFTQAIQMEGDIPARHIALAKAEEKLGKPKKAVEALENAYELDPNLSTLRQMLAIYEANNDQEEIAAITKRIESQIEREAKYKRSRSSKSLRRANRGRIIAKRITRTATNIKRDATDEKTPVKKSAPTSNTASTSKNPPRMDITSNAARAKNRLMPRKVRKKI